jgi:glycine betaine/proline transport system permease protein
MAENNANPWGSAADTAKAGHDSFLSAANAPHDAPFSIMQPFHDAWIPLNHWVDTFVQWIVLNFRPFFTAIKAPVDATLTAIAAGLNAVPPFIMILFMGLLAWQLAGKRLGITTIISLFFLGVIGVWQEAMTTLSLVITSVLFCLLIGIPTGIGMARSERIGQFIRPLLDMMQTTPAFVYLVPVVMLFGIGNVPGVVVTIIFAVPPVIRLTNLGIRQVPEDLIEAANSFGANSRQLLYKVQLPLAMPTILAGVNQTLMLSLSMVVIASMISVGGLGLMVLRGIGRLDIGLATVGGIGIVILAIVLDRMTQALGRDARTRGTRHWYQSGPVGLLLSLKNR